MGIEQVETKYCIRKFRFGENLYTSMREITITIMVQALDGYKLEGMSQQMV